MYDDIKLTDLEPRENDEGTSTTRLTSKGTRLFDDALSMDQAEGTVPPSS